MSGPVPARDPVGQAPRPPRNDEVRRGNHLPRWQAVHAEFEDADAELTEGAAEWGAPIRVLGYDFLLLGLSYTEGTDTTGVQLVAQVAEHNNSEAEWLDLYEADETGAVGRKVWTVPLTETKTLAFRIPVPGGHFLRFKAWATGTNGTNSRILVRARQHMSAQ